MHPSKAPGPDDFNARFFHKFWPAIGDCVTRDVLKVLNEGGDVTDWNRTLIVLIPKKDNPRRVADFRPISLCNTSYKIISKVIVNRLRGVLGGVIDQAQSAFIRGRLITDNILISFECQHWLRNRRKGKEGYAAFKIDMSKAYDRVEWNYLEAVLRKMEFPSSFCDIVMRCVRSVSFAFSLNRGIYGGMKASRGLRQGDPLSPFLFVLCAQGFSSLFHYFENRRKISGVPLIPKQLSITHIFFADDSLLFMKAKREEACAIRQIIMMYEKASGQCINLEKSSITFSPNTCARSLEEVRRVLGVGINDGMRMYLGLPAYSLR